MPQRMYRECFNNRKMDSLGMWALIQTGLFTLLIATVSSRALHEDINREINATHYNEEPTENNCNCEWRYYKHYEAKGCQVMQVDSCGCPKRYLCPLSSEVHQGQKVCVYQNEEYKLGSRINVPDKCQYCRCLGGEEPQITCRHKECPQLEKPDDKNCHLVYEKDQCCPSKYECILNNENEASEKGSFCVHERVTYPLGAKIYPKNDPCLICECSEDWRGITNSSCYQRDCLFVKNKKLLEKGCVPVYHINKCCPIEFLCPIAPSLNDTSFKTHLAVENRENSDEVCTFDGKPFEIGHNIKLDNPCIQCNCMVPPDFTCVHQSCPPTPSIENCEVIYSSDTCCPSYHCLHDDITTDNSSKVVCPTPLCADSSCEIKIPEGHRCPTCVCDESTSHEKNIFEPNEEVIMEGSIKNGNSSSEIEEFENENDNIEMLSPVQMESSNENKSEKFTDDFYEKEHMEYDDIEKLEHEVDRNPNIFDKEEEFENSEIPLHEIPEQPINKKNSIKVHKKRSILNQPQQFNHYSQSQQQFFEEEEEEPNTDREIAGNDDSEEDIDEIKLSRSNKNFEENCGDKCSNEDLIGSESKPVSEHGVCPTPLCANNSCRIEIPPGHRCPTCVCTNPEPQPSEPR